MTEHDNSERKPSTRNPEDYVYLEDLTDIKRGRRAAISNWTMPEQADAALHRWYQGKTHESCKIWIEPAEQQFTRIMGFSPQELDNTLSKMELGMGIKPH